MSTNYREILWPEMMQMDGDEIEFSIQREELQEGRSFSPEAMEMLNDQFLVWVGTRLKRRWDATNEPPTVMTVELRVSVG